MNTCSAKVRHAGGVIVIELFGRITMGEGAALVRDIVKSQVEHGNRSILLDLAGVLTIDSSGLGEISGAYITLARLGGSVKLLHTSKKVDNLLQITRLYTVLATFNDEQEAIESFK